MKRNTTVTNLQINSIQDLRTVVTKVNNFQTANGIKKSQRAKYERTLWEFIACILTSVENKKWTSLGYIQTALAARDIIVDIPSLHRTINIMLDTNSAIHPHRRSCGASCHEVVRAMGGISRSQYHSGGRPGWLFAFNESPALVSYYRRAFNLRLDPK